MFLKTVVVIFGAFMLLGLIIGNVMDFKNQTGSFAPPKPPLTEKQIAEQARAVLGARTLRSAARNPDSLKFSSVGITKKGAVCYEYRAQNGFGGMNVEFAVLTPRSQHLSQAPSAWNAWCADTDTEDLTELVKMLL